MATKETSLLSRYLCRTYRRGARGPSIYGLSSMCEKCSTQAQSSSYMNVVMRLASFKYSEAYLQ